jgi:hypothetical protein
VPPGAPGREALWQRQRKRHALEPRGCARPPSPLEQLLLVMPPPSFAAALPPAANQLLVAEQSSFWFPQVHRPCAVSLPCVMCAVQLPYSMLCPVSLPCVTRFCPMSLPYLTVLSHCPISLPYLAALCDTVLPHLTALTNAGMSLCMSLCMYVCVCMCATAPQPDSPELGQLLDVSHIYIYIAAGQSGAGAAAGRVSHIRIHSSRTVRSWGSCWTCLTYTYT